MAISNRLRYVIPSSTGDQANNGIAVNEKYKGRLNTSSIGYGRLSGSSSNIIQFNVTEVASPEYVEFTNARVDASNSGQTITITGVSNSPSLVLAWVSNQINLSLPTSMTVNGSSYTPGSNISGDPGASDEFAFSISIVIPENTTIEELTSVLRITGSTSEVTATVNIVQSAGEPYLYINTEGNLTLNVTIAQSGATVSFGILSNTGWTLI